MTTSETIETTAVEPEMKVAERDEETSLKRFEDVPRFSRVLTVRLDGADESSYECCRVC